MKTWQDYAGNSGTAITTWKYDERGFLTNKLDNASEGPSYTYTAAGRLATRAWARGVSTSYGYNEAGDLENIDYSDGTPDVDYAYDRQGRPAHVEGATTNDYSFTAHGLLLSEDVLNAGWNYISQTQFGYDALRRRSALTNLSLSVVQDYSYDAASRLDTVSMVQGGLTTLAGYSYLTHSPLIETVTFQRGGTTRLTSNRAHDNLNRLTSISSTNSYLPTPISFSYAYNAANQRTGVTNADASYWLYGYDRLGQVTNGWRYWGGGSNVLGQTFNYTFDDIGNRESSASGGNASGTDLRSVNYSVNLLNQYTNRTIPGYIEVSGTATNSATVRVNGTAATRQGDYFRREVTVNNSSSALAEWLTSVATNANGTTTVARLSYVPQTPEAFTHDADGNLTSDGLWDYVWDGENRLTRIELQTNSITDSAYWQRVECDYDYLSRRLRKRSFGWDTNALDYALTRSIRYFYDGWNPVGQVDEVTGVRLSFLWGTDLSGSLQGAGGVGGLLAMVVHNGSEAGTYFYGYDGNGNVAVLVNAADGSEAARYEYGPFGELTRATGPLANLNPFRFSTKYQDEETGLIYYGYRYYAASMGRWLSRDPIGEAGGVNAVGFLGNNPAGRVDILGLQFSPGINFGFHTPIPFSGRNLGEGVTTANDGTDTALFVGKSFINRIPERGSLDGRGGRWSWTLLGLAGGPHYALAVPGAAGFVSNGELADFRLWLFSIGATRLDAFKEDPATPGKDKQYRLYTRALITATCCENSLMDYSCDIDEEGGRELREIHGTINSAATEERVDDSTVKISWAGWGRPNRLLEPGMQLVGARSSTHIWHAVTVVVSCKDGQPSFELESVSHSSFPSMRLWRDNEIIHDHEQGPFSDLWQPSEWSPLFVAP